jgi:hypothetical protein
MRTCLAFLIGILVVSFRPRSVLALDESWGKVMPYMRTSTVDPDTARWFVIGFAVLAVGLMVAGIVYNRKHTARLRVGSSAGGPRKQRLSFRQQAGVMGFKFLESKVLKKIADRLSPQAPDNLLTTPGGRQFLMADLEKRIRRRQREVETLHGIQDKLEKMREEKSHDRAGIRVDADVPIWIVKKVQPGAGVAAGEDVLVNIEPVTGRLEDISEGGAAVRADLDVAVGDVAEMWSTETGVWIPPITAGVVHREDPEGGLPMLHLRFLDPPVAELRAALHEIQVRNNRAIFGQAEQQRTETQ